MINYNGTIVAANQNILPHTNRGFSYGDAVFETTKISNGTLLFWEDHYFRLMATMRIMRMEIPMSFTMEYLEQEVLKLLEYTKIESNSARVKIVVFRDSEGYYKPHHNEVKFMIQMSPLKSPLYMLKTNSYKVDLYKDNYASPSLLSTLKTNNKALNVLASIYAYENSFDNCLLLNTNKQVIEATNGNLFLVKDKTIKTPPLADGCLKGVMRKQIIDIVKHLPEYSITEESISPFELQKSDELFITNVITGIQPITSYRKKTFDTSVSQKLLGILNLKIRT